MSITLNKSQTKAYAALQKYLTDKNNHNFLLLGAAGSGKTSTIVSVFNNSAYKIAFCAFTNKATQVLKHISDKFNINFKADFSTIHKILMLEPKYNEKETELAFKFDSTKIDGLKNYDVIIFDECSTISNELFSYIQHSWKIIQFKYDHKLKFIFLGDYWQLPPVGEKVSCVFGKATEEKWPISKLDKVMRSNNEYMYEINQKLLLWIDKFRNTSDNKTDIQNYHIKYPFNMIDNNFSKTLYINNLAILLDTYIKTRYAKNISDVVMLTYSRANCEKINYSIQDIIDSRAGRNLPEVRNVIKFYPGDRCCIDRPIEI